MSNRIGLTQFEGIEEWGVEKRPDGGYAIKTGRDNFSLGEAETIAKLPSLIAELKRCYDLIDAQNKNLEFLNGAIEKLHEETWTEAVVELVEEHHPSEWCDYSHCWKCEEEPTSE